MPNKCKDVWRFLYFTWHIAQHAIRAWRKHFLIKKNLNISSYLPYFLENKSWLTFFGIKIFQRTSEIILLFIVNFMYFLVLFVASWAVNFSCALFNVILSYFRMSLFLNVAIFSKKYGMCRISTDSKENVSAK